MNKNINEKNLNKVGRVCYGLLQNLGKKKFKKEKKKKEKQKGKGIFLWETQKAGEGKPENPVLGSTKGTETQKRWAEQGIRNCIGSGFFADKKKRKEIAICGRKKGC